MRQREANGTLWILLLVALVAFTICVAPPSRAVPLSPPIRAVFYYPWFPNAWTQGGLFPYTHYTPTRGYYDGADPAIIASHIEAMQRAKIQAGIASWWGPGHHTDRRIRPLLDGAEGTGFGWALYHEQEGQRDLSSSEIRADLGYIRRWYAAHPAYLRVEGRPVLFVYNADDSSCEVADRWVAANRRVSSRPSSIPSRSVYLVLKVFSGYRNCLSQPDAWHQYGTGGGDGEDAQLPHSYLVAPGFWHAREAEPRMPRDLEAWKADIRRMVASGARWQLIVSFNEWGEGTQIEESEELGSAYLDALATDGA